MGDFILNLLNSPLFVTLATTLLSTIAVDSTISGIKQIKDAIKDMPHEAQLLDCLEQAFFATEKELGWKHDTEAIYDTFFGSLMSFAGEFDRDSLTKIFIDAVSTEVTDNQVELWIENVIKQISLPVHADLREFLKIHHLFYDIQGPSKFISRYILTRNAPMCENPDIIFRDTIVHDLLEKVSVAGSRVQIAGMGGLGKTEILNKLYAQLARDKQHTLFDHIALITFSGEIASDIEAQIDCPSPYCGQQSVEAAKRYLQDVCQEKRVLLCIDDIRPDQTILKRDNSSLVFLRSLGASILLAARVAYPEFEVLDLHFLPTEACISIFEKQYDQTISDAGEIAILTDIIENRAGNHTMIVNRLGNMAKDYGWSISTLSEKLKEKNFNFCKSIDDDELLQQEINKLYQINEKLSPAEINILEAFSIFPASPLPFDLCIDWLHEDAGVDEDKCALLLNKLAEQTWLEKRCDCESNDVYFLMHQLVKTAVQKQIEFQDSTHMNLVHNCGVSLDSYSSNYIFSKASIISSIAISIYTNIANETSQIAKLAISIAGYFDHLANYNSASEWSTKAIEIYEKFYGKDHPDTAEAYNRIAIAYYGQSEYTTALDWFMKALNICEKVLGKEHKNTGAAYNNIAVVYHDLGKYSLALEWYLKALTIRKNVLGEDHPDTALTYHNIAVTYRCQGRLDLAIDWHFKALAILEKNLGCYHPDTASAYNSIAETYRRQGQYDLALEWFLKALAIREKILGLEHPSTGLTYGNIAVLYRNQGDYDSALVWALKELAILDKAFGKENLDTAQTCNNIAVLYYDQGNHDLALEWYKKALAVFESKLGASHLSTITVKNNISEAKKELQRIKKLNHSF